MALAKLQSLLAEYGIRVQDYDQPWETTGFPVVLTLRGGHRVVMDLSDPGVLANIDPSFVGIALCNPKGRIKQAWGLATQLPFFRDEHNLLETELGTLIQSALTDDEGGTIFIDGNRFVVSKAVRGRRVADVLILVFHAEGETNARNNATIQTRSAEMFRRIGKALSMHQTLNELAVLAVHEISSSAGLAAALLWARGVEDDQLKLRAHVGVNRQGTKVVEALEPRERLSCCAELVANRRQSLWIPSVTENVMATNLEAKICYLRPGAASVMPLIVGDRLIGVVELIGREGDASFTENRETFEAIAEHLALALNTCLMFESVERMASYDPLTGVANHRALQDFLHSRVAEAERTGAVIGVAMLDVDHFRSFNEEEGHDAGDYVLKEVAAAIKEAVRPYDLPARYGGEEFSIIMPGLDLEYSAEVAERVRSRIERIEYVSANGRVRHVTASLGVSSFPETALDPASLLKAADIALFRAKRGGRNRVEVYTGRFQEEGTEIVEVDHSWMERWMTPEDMKTSAEAYQFLKPFLEFVVQKLQLSKSQSQILEQLVRIYPSYKRLMAENAPDIMRELEMASEFRPLLPSLMTLQERFDGTGPMKMAAAKIPLLSRVMSVLLALSEGRGKPLISDPGKYDPEIVSMIADVQEAA